ncbi:MAG: hypothetical protein QOH75_1997 [Actinomycetota bacterium]|jgi:hypothetical protein|nr:hypothetical protein [Actinomycetota bacterium]
MRVLLDEDVPEQLVEPLRHLTPGHTIDYVGQTRWAGKKDPDLYRAIRGAGYDVIVTNDRSQLNDPGLTKEIRRSQVHHVRYSQKHPGLRGLALALGALIAALPTLLDELATAEGQMLVHVHALDPRKKRHTVRDPRVDPPAYWGRRPRRR